MLFVPVTVHREQSVKKEYQQDAKIWMISCQFQKFIIDYCLDMFRAFYAHHQEKRPRDTAYGVFC